MISLSKSDDLFSEKKNYSKPGKLLKDSLEPKFNFGKETDYELPKLDLLEEGKRNINTNKNNKDLLQQNAKLLENVIKEFKFSSWRNSWKIYFFIHYKFSSKYKF